MSALTPTPKQQAVGVAGAASLVLVWALGQFGIEVPELVASSAVLVIAWLAGYLLPTGKPGRRERGRDEHQAIDVRGGSCGQCGRPLLDGGCIVHGQRVAGMADG